MVLRQPAAKAGLENLNFSPKEIADYRRKAHTLAGLVEYHGMAFTLFAGEDAVRVRTGVVSAGFFDFFGIRPLLGRTFVEEDDRPGAPAVLVLSYEFWRSHERADPNIVGRVYKMNDRPHTVIGVLPPIPQYPDENDVYMTTTSCPTRSSPRMVEDRTARMMNVFARLKPDADLELCRRDMAGLARQFQQDDPRSYPAELGYSATASLLRDDLTKRARGLFLVLAGAAGFVLLIACANVANLILARMSRRESELAIRTAVGAGGGRLLRQLLTESLIMGLLAAGIGILFAYGSVRLLTLFAGEFTPRAREIAVNGWVLGFAALCATGTSVLFGSVAALYSRRDLAGGLKENSRAGVRRDLLRSALIAAQVAFSFILLVGAGLMLRSFVRLANVQTGFATDRVLAVGLMPNWSRLREPEQFRSLDRRLLQKLEAQPGVVSASISSGFPLNPNLVRADFPAQRMQVQGEAGAAADQLPIKLSRAVSPAYLRTLGIPVLAGRGILESDQADSPLVALITRGAALKRWGSRDPLGRRISFDGEHWMEIVGVVADTREFGPAREAPSQVYVPLAQEPRPGAILVRAQGDPAAISGMVRRAIREVDPEMAFTWFESLEQARADAIASPRTLTQMFSLFAGLALLIAIAGIGSMLALWVRQRTREIGIRMAMGAAPSAILAGFLKQGMLLTATGLVIGAVAASSLTGILRAMLFEVEPTDVPTFLVVAALLLAAALVACWIPARRASRIDPQTALRCE